ncbi:MAG TPA: sugar nucleotide-binding protein, partial [Chthoniobacterales bacterium]
IFTSLAEGGRKRPVLTRIASTDYPTAARRPANSRLDCRKLARLHGVELPSWRTSLEACLRRLTNNAP